MNARKMSIALAALLSVSAPATARAAAAFSWDEVVEAYAHVHDYTCTYDKQERAIDNGDLQVIRLSYRKPLDVKLEWVTPYGKVEQIAVYRQGMNDGKLLARRTGGIASWLGTMKLGPTSGRALEDSRHPITEVGIGHIVATVAQEIASGRATMGPAAEEMLDGRPVSRVELEGKDGVLVGVVGGARATIWIDRELKLPVKIEIRDSAGGLVERHQFSTVRINVGLTDQVFTL